MNILASMSMPKQRITRPYEFILVHGNLGDYSVHRQYTDETGGMDCGSYALTFKQAWQEYVRRIEGLIEYGPNVFEEGEKS